MSDSPSESGNPNLTEDQARVVARARAGVFWAVFGLIVLNVLLVLFTMRRPAGGKSADSNAPAAKAAPVPIERAEKTH